MSTAIQISFSSLWRTKCARLVAAALSVLVCDFTRQNHCVTVCYGVTARLRLINDVTPPDDFTAQSTDTTSARPAAYPCLIAIVAAGRILPEDNDRVGAQALQYADARVLRRRIFLFRFFAKYLPGKSQQISHHVVPDGR